MEYYHTSETSLFVVAGIYTLLVEAVVRALPDLELAEALWKLAVRVALVVVRVPLPEQLQVFLLLVADKAQYRVLVILFPELSVFGDKLRFEIGILGEQLLLEASYLFLGLDESSVALFCGLQLLLHALCGLFLLLVVVGVHFLPCGSIILDHLCISGTFADAGHVIGVSGSVVRFLELSLFKRLLAELLVRRVTVDRLIGVTLKRDVVFLDTLLPLGGHAS